MNPNTKKRVTIAWNSQRVLRALALIGALGAVFCIVTIRKTSTPVGWIIRAGPGVALAHTLYAAYFFCRGINSRPSASCASYQMFAAVIDTGLLPFFALSCYMAAMDHTSNQYEWTTLFNDNTLDSQIIQAFMIVCAVEGGLFIGSLVIDVYLAAIYRKITQLPPDANPLAEQDKLTGAGRQHKRNKSELIYEKHLSNSTVASQRFSQMNRGAPGSRRVPFKHTRTDSADSDSFSIQKDFLNEIRDPYSAHASMLSLAQDNPALSRPASAVTPATNARPAGAGLEHKPARSSGLAHAMSLHRPQSWLSYSDYEGMPATMSDYAQDELEGQVRSMSPVSAISGHENDLVRKMPSQHECYPPITALAQQHPANHFDQENDMPSPDQISLALPPAYTPPKKRSREPLGMNPPTPVNKRLNDEGLVPRPLSMSGYSTPPRQSLHETESNSVMYHTPASSRPAPPSRPASFVGSGTKSRFYGNLRTSLGGSPTRNGHDEFDFDLQRSATTKSAESGNFEVYDSASDYNSDTEYDPYPSHGRLHHGPPVVVGELSPGRQWTIGSNRQVSNSTGHDLHNGYAGLDPEFANTIPRRREVSGKMAEEGRNYQFSTSTAELQTKPGAAGWARFKGL